MTAPPVRSRVDFDQAPLLVIWETTQACDLACLHCRAEAQPRRDCGELSTLEAMAMMNDVRRFGRCLFVLTGGDPFKRPDLLELVQHGARIGLRMGLTPSATPLVTAARLAELQRVGLGRLAMSLDGATAATHDHFRGVVGSFQLTIDTLEAARGMGLPTQVNTTLTRETMKEFDGIVELVSELGIALWSVFFLVPVGRGRQEDVLSAEAFEDAFHRMYDLSLTAPFDIKSTAAPHYRRVVIQRQVEERRKVVRPRGVNDGNGFLFITHRGEVCPSGFLPIGRGNVRGDDLVKIYRDDPFFRSLRDPDSFQGKCGVCEFRKVCGGSRARAWAVTGSPLASEPFCTHMPARWNPEAAPSPRAVRRLPVVSASRQGTALP